MKSIRRKSETGFTLIEMMFVVVIFGILAALSWNAVSTTHYEVEVRGLAFQLSSMAKALRARAISTGLEQGLAINFGPNEWVTPNVRISANSWAAFQGNLPCSPLTCNTLFGDEDSASSTATLGNMLAPGFPLQTFHNTMATDGKTGKVSLCDIYTISNCTCEAANGACGACPLPAENTNVVWLLFQPDSTITVPSLNNRPINFTIYLGLSEFVTGNYTNDFTVSGTPDPMNRQNRWRVVVSGYTGRVRLLRGWGDANDPDPTAGGT